MGVLDEALAYLAGAMDFSPDQGRSWRREIIQKCKNTDLKIKFLDPTNKVSSLKKEVDEERLKHLDMKRSGSLDEFSKIMKIIVRHDHRCVDISDFIICYVDVDIHMCGSYFELRSALSQKKPHFVIIKQGKRFAPSWLFGIIDYHNMYDSIDDVVTELNKLNNGEDVLCDKWVLIRKEIHEL